MQSTVLRVAISLALWGCVFAQTRNITESLEAYINENKRQNDDRLKFYDDQLVNFRLLYAKQLEPIDVQADSMQLKLEEATSRLAPIALINAWTKQCVQNYSSTIPTITAARTSITNCKVAISYILGSAENTYNLLKIQYSNTLVNALASCVRLYSTHLLNYTLCVTNAIAENNRYTLSNQDTFNTYIRSAECSADEKIRNAWQCTFKQVYTMSSNVEIAGRLVDTCIENQAVCGSVNCTSSCPNVTRFNLEEVRGKATITNPFNAVSANQDCLEFRFN